MWWYTHMHQRGFWLFFYCLHFDMRKLATGFLFNFIINILLTFSTFEHFSIFYFNWIEFIPVCFAYLWDALKCSSFGVCDRFHIWPLATVLFCFSLYAGIFMWRDTCYWLKIAVLWFFYYYFCAKLYKINCLLFFDNNTFSMVAKCQNNCNNYYCNNCNFS